MIEKRYFISPVTIPIIMILFSILIFIGSGLTFIITVSLSIALLLTMYPISGLKTLVALSAMFGLSLLMKNHLKMGMWLGSVYGMLMIIIKISPVWILGKLLSNLNSSELLTMSRKLRLPNSLSVSVAVFFRFLPEFFARLNEVKQGAHIRGYKLSPLHPLKSFELVVVPLLYKAINVSETLTCSIITKGIEYDCNKTSYRNLDMTYRDYVLLVVCTILIPVELWIL